MATAPRAGLPRRRRRRQRSEEEDEPKKLYRPDPESYKGALELLNRVSLTRDDIDKWLCGEMVDIEPHPVDPHVEAYNQRRREIREMAAKVATGEAEVDEHMRLMPTPRPEPPDIELPLPPPAGRPRPAHPEDQEEEERQWLEREDEEAAEAIARAVKRYRQEGVPEEDFFLCRIPRREQSAVNLTFRRICFAVLAVTTAFVCLMLQTLPLIRPVRTTNLEFDKLMYELLEVRDFYQHLKHCPGLHREDRDDTWMQRLARSVLTRGHQLDVNYNCAAGVLHIPAKHLIPNMLHEASKTQEGYEALRPYLTGVNVSWSLPCHVPEEVEAVSACFSEVVDTSICNVRVNACFRGVHDNIISEVEVDRTLQMGARLIDQGGDHDFIYHDNTFLSKHIPDVISKLKYLLRTQYNLQGQWDPVAFRVSVGLPMDGAGYRLYGYMADGLLEKNINRSVYYELLEKTKRKNDLAAYRLPPPFATKSERNPCYLMSDLDADPDFAVHTSVFLSDAAGVQYVGGAALYVDDHPSNAKARNKIQRGISIDGSRGRIVVSTGGAENRRCRLPTRAGIRAVLQIWWNCTM